MTIEILGGRRVIWSSTPGPITFHFGDNLEKTIEQTWPPMNRALGIVLTNYCPLACKHCYNNSSPNGEEMLAFEDLKAFVEFLVQQGHPLSAVGLSGGEALYHPNFFEIAEYMAQQDLYVSCNTGGHGLCSGTMAKMKDHGVREAVFSSDWYHEKFVSQHNLFDLVEHASKLFERTTVKIAVETREHGQSRLGKLDTILDKSVDIVVQPVLRIGRGASKRFADIDSGSWNGHANSSSCAAEFEVLGINYDGRVYACCSVGSFTPGLELGRVQDRGGYSLMSEAYLRKSNLQCIHGNGWDVDMLKNAGMHKCEMCHSQAQCVA